MYLPDNIQEYLRKSGALAVNEAAKKEGDLYIAVNVVDQQRRIINVNDQTIKTLIEQFSSTPVKPISGRGLLKG